MEAPRVIPKRPPLEPGEKARGKVHDCHDKWVKFDWTVPHCTLSFKGKRYTIVYFTHKNRLGAKPSMKGYYESLGFTIPNEAWLEMGNVDGGQGKPRTHEKHNNQIVVEDDEIDEGEQVDVAMRREIDCSLWRGAHWATAFREHAGAT